MLEIPYIKAPDESACALACYTMVAKYFFPETTFEEIAKVSNWEKGYVVWAFRFWEWIMNKGIRIEDYDLMSLQAWAEEGIEGLRKSVPEKEFNFYKEHSKDLNAITEDIRRVMSHKNLTYHQQKPTYSDLVVAFNDGAACEVVLNSRALDNREGFALHRVVVLDITDKDITFHDPRVEPRPARQESIELFRRAWLEEVAEPELCVYKRSPNG